MVGSGTLGYTISLTGSVYLNSNAVNIRFVNGNLSGSNLSYWTFNVSASLTSSFLSSSQDILVTNITKSADNNYINRLDSGSNIIRRSDGITSNTVYTGDLYFSETIIETKGVIPRV